MSVVISFIVVRLSAVNLGSKGDIRASFTSASRKSMVIFSFCLSGRSAFLNVYSGFSAEIFSVRHANPLCGCGPT